MISGAHVAYGLTKFPTNGPFPRLLTTTTKAKDVLLSVHYDQPFTYYFSRDVDDEGESLSDFYFCCAKMTRDNDKCGGRKYYWPRHVYSVFLWIHPVSFHYPERKGIHFLSPGEVTSVVAFISGYTIERSWANPKKHTVGVY